MRVEFHRKFAKDLTKISLSEILGKIKEVILLLENADDLRTLTHVKALKGGGGFFGFASETIESGYNTRAMEE